MHHHHVRWLVFTLNCSYLFITSFVPIHTSLTKYPCRDTGKNPCRHRSKLWTKRLILSHAVIGLSADSRSFFETCFKSYRIKNQHTCNNTRDPICSLLLNAQKHRELAYTFAPLRSSAIWTAACSRGTYICTCMYGDSLIT